jgi:Chalcone isomerase-like
MRSALAVCACALLWEPSGADERPRKDGFLHTGSAVRTKAVTIVRVKLYAIRHDIKCSVAKEAQAIVLARCDKRFSLRFLRDMDAEKLREHFSAGFKLNGFADHDKQEAFLAAFKSEFHEGQTLQIRYAPEPAQLTIELPNGAQITVAGAELMKAVWSLWFGKSDQEGLADSLMSNL